MVDRNENSADVSKTKDGRSFSAEITHSKIKNITAIKNLERKEVKHMQSHCKVLEHQL